jgi:hypothetical protein
LQQRRHLQLTGRALAFFVLVISACRDRDPPPIRSAEPRLLPAPAANDVGENCHDVFQLRVCWSGDMPVLVERPLPALPSTLGYRCRGSGQSRVCEDRRHGADPFQIGARSTQRHPRMPDDAEWECADLDGVVVCHRGEPAAGIVTGAPDPAFVCGDRRGKKGDRVCVDFAPDRPKEPASCHFEHRAGEPARVCTAGGRGALTRPCAGGCPFGAACVSDTCLPLAPKPNCWLDQDCGSGERCGFGTCRKVGP